MTKFSPNLMLCYENLLSFNEFVSGGPEAPRPKANYKRFAVNSLNSQ